MPTGTRAADVAREFARVLETARRARSESTPAAETKRVQIPAGCAILIGIFILFWLVNIVGGMARTPNPGFTIGGSVNAALANFSKALAGQGLVDDVNVNTIHPGQVQTERLTEMMADQAAAQGKTPEQVLEETIQRQGLRRLGTPEDVAELALFLCLPRARHIQGTSISVDGGGTKSLF